MKDEDFYREVGIRMKALREVAGITQEEFGDALGLTRTSIINIEAGRQRMLLSTVAKVAGILGITPEAFMRGVWPSVRDCRHLLIPAPKVEEP